jgi:hypothetical protein
MRASSFDVNWRTLLIGRDGPGKYPPLLSQDDVRRFAAEKIAERPDEPPDTLTLAIASSDDDDEVIKNLRRLAEQQPGDPARELRKWRLVLLKEVIGELPQDPLYGLLRLTEFWERFDYPSDGPHIVQGRQNQLTPGEYYTSENFERVVRRHEEWISAEDADLGRGKET